MVSLLVRSLAKRGAGGSPADRYELSYSRDYLWICPSGACPPPHASAIRVASCPSAAARPSNDEKSSMMQDSTAVRKNEPLRTE